MAAATTRADHLPKTESALKSYIPMQRMDTSYWFKLEALFHRNYFHGESI
jgi:hypothetical protein